MMQDFTLSFSDWLAKAVIEVEQSLDGFLPPTTQVPSVLHEAMRYAVLGSGKRIRAALVYATGLAVQGEALDLPRLSASAAAVELIHSYSLVHDDLPCMDDDDMRRGRPTCHIQYGEAIALLAADALQPLAFEVLSKMSIEPSKIVQAVQTLSQASGSLGMVGGQVIDVTHVGQTLTLEQLQQMHRMKTGAMIESSVLLGAIVSGANPNEQQALANYAKAMGLAFQVMDDILDVTADSQALGKTAGKDAQANKPTYVSLMGLEASKALATELHQEAITVLSPLGEKAKRLQELADFMICRHY